jgi:hypothetical protein
MPAEIAARQAGRAVAAAPGGAPWLVRAQGAGAEPLFVDVLRKGEVLDWRQAKERCGAPQAG